MTAVAVSFVKIASVALSIEIVLDKTMAFDGVATVIEKPNAATAVKAIRLKNVFFDITFLSLVAKETFSKAAGKEKLFTS
jgi:hypothetical protein